MYLDLCKTLVNDFIANPDSGGGFELTMNDRALSAPCSVEGVESARLSYDREGSHGSHHGEGNC